MNEELFFTPITVDTIQCNLCFRHCHLHSKTGYCGVNSNISGKLTCETAGYPLAIQCDPIEKKPLYHFLPGEMVFSIGSAGCNFACPFCQNHSLVNSKLTKSQPPLSINQLLSQIPPSVKIIAFTYNEPTVNWLWYREIAIEAKRRGLKTVFVTNGAMSKEVARDMIGKIDAINLDIKCGSDHCYREILGGSRSTVMSNLDLFLRNDIWVEITTLLVPKISDRYEDLMYTAEEVEKLGGNSIPWHLSAYHPAYRYHSPRTDDTLITQRCSELQSQGFVYVYPGNTISGDSNTYCSHCSTLLIERSEYNTSLHSRHGKCPQCNQIIEGVFL